MGEIRTSGFGFLAEVMPLDRSWMNLDILEKDILLCNSHNLSSNSLPNPYTFIEQNNIPSSVVVSQHCCME